ncbi:unnamed protein product [Mesocestoides corti]|nr:unnamed protein product [Mesocestoides corti]
MLNLNWALRDMAVGTLPFFIVFGGAAPYIPQYLEIRRLKNSDGFSPYVCLALIVANLLRIGFWFGQPFPTPLLFQSFLMVTTMMFMLHACVKYRQTRFADEKDHFISDLEWSYFWQWSDYASYVKFTALFVVLVGVPCFTFSPYYFFVQTLGFVALFIEALLGVPQFLQNYKHSSTIGMSLEMVLMWTVGDLFKTIYFLMSKSPVQFTVCSCIQISVDFAILLQFIYYSRKQTKTDTRLVA